MLWAESRERLPRGSANESCSANDYSENYIKVAAGKRFWSVGGVLSGIGKLPTTLQASFVASTVEKNPPHGLGGSPKEMAPTVPMSGFFSRPRV